MEKYIIPFLAHPILWGVVAIATVGAAFSGKLSVSGSVFCMWGAYFLAVIGAHQIAVKFDLDFPIRLLSTGAAACVLAIATIYATRWLNDIPPNLLDRAQFVEEFAPVDFRTDIVNANAAVPEHGGFTVTYGQSPAEHLETADFKIQGRIQNYGRLPAINADAQFFLYLGKDLPSTPKYEPDESWTDSGKMPSGPFQIGKVNQPVAAGGIIPITGEFHIMERVGAIIGPADLARMPPITVRLYTDRAFFFVYGIVRYRDQLEKTREQGFAKRYVPQDRSLQEAGGSAYNFDREITPPKEPQ